MTLFWIMGAIMIALALAFVLPAMLKPPAKTEVTASSRELNTELFKERAQELERDLADGLIEQEQFETAREDLERELLHDLGGKDSPAADHDTSGRWMMAALAGLVPLVALSIYLNVGETSLAGLEHTAATANAERRAAPNQVAQQADQQHAINDMVRQLADRLAQDPNDAEGWLMLGRSYMVLEQYQQADQAFGRARELTGDRDAGLLASHAEAVGLLNGGQLAGKPATLIQAALDLDPANTRALWLMGHYQLQVGNTEAAGEHWRRLLASMPANSDQAGVIRDYLAQIGEAADSEPVAPADVATVEVAVSLDPGLAAAAGPEDTVFVFARAAEGPRMPLAIIRGQVKDLPMTVTLDDSLAMSPTMTLSTFDQVVVGARVSKSGNAIPQPGDLEGASGAVAPGPDTSVRVTIDRVVN